MENVSSFDVMSSQTRGGIRYPCDEDVSSVHRVTVLCNCLKRQFTPKSKSGIEMCAFSHNGTRLH